MPACLRFSFESVLIILGGEGGSTACGMLALFHRVLVYYFGPTSRSSPSLFCALFGYGSLDDRRLTD